jgi:hypothetical protein
MSAGPKRMSAVCRAHLPRLGGKLRLLETLLTALDLVCWTKLLGFRDTPALGHAEISTFRTWPPASPAAPARSTSAWTRPGNTPTISPEPGELSAPPSPNDHGFPPTRTPTS